MKKLITISLCLLFALPVLATSRTTTTRSYESTSTSSPVMGSDMNSSVESDADMIEAQEDYDEASMEEQESFEEQESRDEDMIDYDDRTRTNRARKALNTSGDASDDE